MNKGIEKRNWQRFVFLFIVLAVAVWIGKYKYLEWRMEKGKEIQIAKEQKEEKEKRDRLVSQMASKYNAVNKNWPNLLRRYKYSIEVEKALRPNDGRPILIIAVVDDIIKKDDKLFALFSIISIGMHYRFSLECNRDQFSEIQKHKSDKGAYAVVANITSIKKEKYPNHENELEEGFLADGQCVDLMYLKDEWFYYLEKQLLNLK